MGGLSYQELLAQNERLKEEVMVLKGRLRELEEPGEGKPRAIYIGGRRKGTGASYDILRLSRNHRQILYILLEKGAISKESGVPAIQIRKAMRIGQDPLSGRVAELIRKGYVSCEPAKVLFQPDAEGSWRFRPETAYDPAISARHYKRFIYWITTAGKRKLKETVTTDDDFVKADIGALIEIKKAAEGKKVAVEAK